MLTNIQKQAKTSLLLSTMVVSLLSITACQNHSNIEQGQTNQSQPIMSKSISTNQHVNKGHSQKIIPSQLQRYHWTLVNALDRHNRVLKPLADIKSQVVLNFAQYNNNPTVSFSVGCNSMGASYQLANNVITINNAMSTQMLCQDLEQAERQLNELMQGSSELNFKSGAAPILTQITSNHTTLIWQGKLTPQARYNQQGETIFWDIKGETQPCNDGMGNTTSCLQIRPISYNAQGQKNTQGSWQLFNGEIEGYEHDDGVNQTLRLTRYVVNAPHIKGKQYAYVLDQVVESEVTQ